ncbi:cytochrome P450 [Cytidiella melzeri]|nr:cytochrome P450 [Cytidiella melzeri]
MIFTRRKGPPLPPGPPADPIIGHLRIFPRKSDRDEVFRKWARKYGDVFSLRVLGQTIVVLNSEKAATELLEKRSAQYSDRPPFPIFDRIGWKGGLLFARYGTPEFNYQKKLFHSTMQKSALPAFVRYQNEEVNIMLRGLLDNPQDFERVMHRASIGIVLAATYGIRIKTLDDPFVHLAGDLGTLVQVSARPSLLDVFPFCDKLPAWFPGAWFIKYIEGAKPILHNIIHSPYEKFMEELASGNAPFSIMLQQFEAMSEEDRENPDAHRLPTLACSQIVGGKLVLTWHSLTTFAACMLLNPHVQARAQDEIDKVVGRDRLPEYEDRQALPYVECVLYETMRWQPVIPPGVPHKNMADDYYEGMLIPKGAIIVANARSLTCEEDKYHEPRVYKPERFLPKPEGAGEKFPLNAVFGWGRRICPGRHLADATLWLAFARILAVFNINKAKDAEGRPIDPKIQFEVGLSSHPKPFECDISPRDGKAHTLIEESYAMI